MKKILLPLLIIMLHLVTANAQNENRLVISAGTLKHLSFGDKMKVVLVKAGPDQSGVSMSEEVFQKLEVTFSKSSLHVQSREASKNEVVYVLVNDVKSITLGQNTSISNEGIWINKNIDLFVSDGATARLKTSAEVKAYPLGESAVNVDIRPLPSQSSARIF